MGKENGDVNTISLSLIGELGKVIILKEWTYFELNSDVGRLGLNCEGPKHF